MSDAQADPRAGALSLLWEGLACGFTLGLADLLATGPWRVPGSFTLFVLATCTAAGLVAGLVVLFTHRRGAAAALVLAGAVALGGASLVTKELSGSLPLLFGVVILSLLSGVLTLILWRTKGGLRAASIAIASVPAGSLLAACMGFGLTWIAIALLLPLVVLRLLAGRKARTVLVVAALLAVALPLPVLLLDPTPRAHVESTAAGASAAMDAPDVILVVIDTLRADAVDWTPGASRTPTFAALAEGGLRFDSAITSAPWTLPSMASLFTGLLPSQHGAVDRLHALPAEAVTLAEQFRAGGYQTAAFTGGAFLDPGYGLAQGFEHFDARAEYWFRPLRIHVPLAWRVVKNRFLPLRRVLRHIEEFGGLQATRVRLGEWLGTQADERPLFLLLHTYSVHDYYLYHPDPDDSVRERLGNPPRAVGERLTVNPEELFDLDAQSLAWFEAIYQARVEQADRQVGDLLEDLRLARKGRNRLIVMTADHGEGFDASTGRVHHGGRLHDDLLRIPLVLAWESEGDRIANTQPAPIAAGRVVSEQVRQVDLAPTLLELAGVEPLVDTAGTSLLAPLAGTVAFPIEAWAEEHMAGPRWLALFASRWKLVDGPAGKQRFDLDSDPGELAPLDFAGVPDLDSLWSSFDERYPARVRSRASVDASVQHQLDHIGYGD